MKRLIARILRLLSRGDMLQHSRSLALRELMAQTPPLPQPRRRLGTRERKPLEFYQ